MTIPAPSLPVAFWISFCWLAIRIAAADIAAATRPLIASVQRLRLTAKAAETQWPSRSRRTARTSGKIDRLATGTAASAAADPGTVSADA